MATVTKGKIFISGETVEPADLHQLVDSATVTEIVNADIKSDAAIAGTKIDPNFGSQNAVTTGTVTAAKLIPTGTSATGNGVYLPAANTVAVSTDGTERMRVAATGEVCVNTTTTDGYLNVGSGSGQFPNGIVVKPTSHATSKRASIFVDNWGVLQDVAGSGTKDLAFYSAAANSARMVIDTNGFILAGKTSADFATAGVEIDPAGVIQASRTSGSAAAFNRLNDNGTLVIFRRGTSIVGSVSVTTTATTYNTSSDHRLKENVQPMTGALEKVAEMKPVTFDWKVNGEKGQGFIAHELQAVVPEAVTGAKDAVDADGNPEYQGVDPSKLVAILVAAVQELSAKVAALEAK